jgi:periplasmic protein TonB
MLLTVFSAAAQEEHPSKTEIAKDTIYLPETPAEFPGGEAGIRAYLSKNFVYPQIALENGLQGKCYLRFTISSSGYVSEVKVIRGVPDCHECDEEALRLIRCMPQWIPAKKGDQPVASTYQMPVIFKLQ